MILVDANLLIYGIDRESAHHSKARTWVEQILSDKTPVGIAWIVVLAFLRVTTIQRQTQRVLTPERAIGFVDSWFALPHVSLVLPGKQHWLILRNLIQVSGTSGNLTSDAHLAALAIEHGYTVFTADRDFHKFAGVSVVNPLVS
ncbi:MAG TPA: TA system VapC family ribonuclease toxin [Thermoanaerobaculia bacterium]|jgi:toxin-antitoxin system PIN domain toxin|nr:TA system VapC family ribonuclease toxin [Thermoanaerobaculia bacterium]